MFSFEDVPKIVVIHWLVADTVPQMMDMKACREWTDSISSFPHYRILPSASMPLSSLCSSWCSLCPWWWGERCPWWSLDGQLAAVKWELMCCARQHIVIWVTPNLLFSSSSSSGCLASWSRGCGVAGWKKWSGENFKKHTKLKKKHAEFPKCAKFHKMRKQIPEGLTGPKVAKRS